MAIGGAFKLPSLEKDTQEKIQQHKENNLTSFPHQNRLYSQVVKGQQKGQPPQPDLENSISDRQAAQGSIYHLESTQIEDLQAQLKTRSFYQGKPALFFNLQEKAQLVCKLKYVLVGKFSHGRPAWHSVQSFFSGLKLSGHYNISIFDQKHLYIECSNKCDFDRLWLRLSWSIDGYIMRVFKWGPDFSPLIETSNAPIWIRMEGLPLYMFDEMTILNLANAIGNPIKIDARNSKRTMLNLARVCVELDVTKPLIDSIKVVFIEEESGDIVDEHLVKVYYDYVPPYCYSCSHIGHLQSQCKRRIDGSKEIESSHRLGKEQAHKTDNNLEAQPKKMDVVQVSTSASKGHYIKLKENGKIENWKPVIREKKFVANNGVTGEVCVSHNGANNGVMEQLNKEVFCLSNEGAKHSELVQTETEKQSIRTFKNSADVSEPVAQNDAEPEDLTVIETSARVVTDQGSPEWKVMGKKKAVHSQKASNDAPGQIKQTVLVQNSGAKSKGSSRIEPVQLKMVSVTAAQNRFSSLIGQPASSSVLMQESAPLKVLELAAAKMDQLKSTKDWIAVKRRHDKQIGDTIIQDANEEIAALKSGNEVGLAEQIEAVSEHLLEKTGLEEKAAYDMQMVVYHHPLQTATDFQRKTLVVHQDHSRSTDVNDTELQLECISQKIDAESHRQVISGQNASIMKDQMADGDISRVKSVPIDENNAENGTELVPDHHLVSKKNNKPIGVVTRSQMKTPKNIVAVQLEGEETAEHHTPKTSKKTEEYKARHSNKIRRKEVMKLSNRINKIASRLKDKSLRDDTKRQLQADMEALKDEHSRLC